ncbi:MAG: type II secretion system secretin GspD [Rhizobacter sp.]|nr:type II secretion system secretin GspD [Rhizobacter sp.]
MKPRTTIYFEGRYLTARRMSSAVCAAVCLGLLPPAPLFAQTAAQKAAATRFRGEPVTLNFVNADIEGVSRAMAAILKQQFVVDPRVKGTITLYNEQPLSPRDAYLSFLAALRGLGFTVVEVGGLYKVVPEADAKLQAGTVSIGDVSRRGDQVITQVFRINHESANNLVPVLRPLISPNNTINANPGNNTLVITDYADNLQRIAKIIAAMDTPAGGDVEVIALQHAVATDIAAMVQRLSDSGPAVAIPGAAGGAALSILVDARSNSLIVRAPNVSRMASVRSLIEKLDQPMKGANALGNIWVVYLKNADAVKLAGVLRAAYVPGGGGGGGGGGGASIAPTAPIAAAPGGATPATAPVAASASPSTGGFVQADPATNSLIITGPEPMYRQLRAVIDQLDSRRAQVYIETMIVKVDATKAAEIGFQWQALSGQKGDRTIVGVGTNFPGSGNIISLSAATAQGANATGFAAATQAGIPGGFNIGVLNKIGSIYTLGALAKFLETNADANVLSTPNLVSLDNEEAKIVIGQNVPFITGTFTNTGTGTGATNPFQTIERKDVGLTLRVKPQIGEGGTVRMTIFQENSSVASAGSSAGPTTDKSSIETTVVVDDGQIMVLGGLLKDEFTGSAGKVPLLGDLPVVGGLFRSDNRTRVKSNLMVFLKPMVIRTQQAANDLTFDRYDSIRALQENAQPEPSKVMRVNDAPVIPALQAPQGAASAPIAFVPPPPPLRMPTAPAGDAAAAVTSPVRPQVTAPVPLAPAASAPRN